MKQPKSSASVFTETFFEDQRFLGHLQIQKGKYSCIIPDLSVAATIISLNRIDQGAVGSKFLEGIWLLIEITMFQVQNVDV